MTVVGTLVVRRPHRGYRDRFRKYKVYVDDVHRGDLSRGAELALAVPPGPHTVVARIDWCSSPEVAVQVLPGGTQTLAVFPGGPWWTAIFQLFTPRSYLTLSPVIESPPTR